MAKISELSDGGSLQSTDFLIAVRSGGNVKVQADGNLSLGTVTADGLTVDGDVTVTGASAISLSSEQHITYQTTSTNATAGDHIFKSYNTEIMRIDGNNNRVGIGTGLCGAPLSFADSAALKIQFNGNAANYYGISKLAASGGGDGDLTFTAGQTAAGNFTFDSGGSERMRITSAGYVGIGVTDPDQALIVKGVIETQASNSTNGWMMYTYTDNSLRFNLNGSGTDEIVVDSSGNVGIGTTPGVRLHVEGATNSNVMIVNNIGTAPNYIFDVRDDGTSKFRVDPSGNVGIGTDSPNTLTHIYGGSSGRTWTVDGNDLFALENDSSLAFDIRTPNASQGLILFSDADARAQGIVGYAHINDFMYFNTNGSERMRIDSSGNLLVGTTNTANIATATPNVVTDESYGVTDGTNKAAYGLERINFDSSNYYVLNASATGVRLINGNTSWTTQSDETLKENITTLTDVLPKVQNLRCVSYNLKSQTENDVKLGFIAQDWQADFPQVVNADASDGKLGMNYTETIPVLLKAIQEQQDLIESLTARIAALEGAN